MSYVTAVEEMPRDLQMPMLKAFDAFQRDMHQQLAVRREDFEKLKDAVYALSVAQKQGEARLTRLETAVINLTEAQKHTEQRVNELAEAQRQSEARLTRLETVVVELAEAQKRTESTVQMLVKRQQVMNDQLGRTTGRQLESHYRDRAHAYFGRILRKTRVVTLQELEPELEPVLSEREIEDVNLLDLLIRGQVAQLPQRPDVYLAFEISSTIDRGDVERAVRRAALLRKAGYTAIPGVAGEDITQGGLRAAEAAAVFVVQDGRKEFWDQALAAVAAA
ncbi:MAG: hypothetical protein IAE85_13310 [Anaerolinea sp.]|nr:hypothetical protein [Anaerolinea sp.]